MRNDLERKEFSKILIIKPSSLGDVVRSLAILGGLRGRFGRAHISWLVRPDCAAILCNNPHLDEIIEFDRRRWGNILCNIGAARDFWGFLSRMRRNGYDLVLDLQGLFRSAFISVATGAPVRVGFAGAREFAPCFYTHRVTIPREPEHIVESYWRFAHLLGFGQFEKRFEIPLDEAVIESAHKLLFENQLGAGEPYLVLLIGGTEAAKRWGVERFAALADAVYNRYHIRSVLLGAGSEENAAAGQVVKYAQKEIINLVDKTGLEQAIAILRSARLVVGNDSGPLHLAAALSVPLVGLYGPTNPVVVGPYGQLDNVVQAGPDQPRTQRYSLKLQHRMQNISVDEVLKTVNKKLRNK